jgi:hypothetical protein
VFAVQRQHTEDGAVVARAKYEYVFRCDCLIGQARKETQFPRWSSGLEKHYVPEYIDKPIWPGWIVQEILGGRKKDPEFVRRMNIWGKELFLEVWKNHEAQTPKPLVQT